VVKVQHMKKYVHNTVEEKVKGYWHDNNIFKTELQKDTKDKKMVIGMFPYPSGDGLHIGHVRIFSGVDFLARFYRLKGDNVLHAIGWDAFGLPAEQAALKKNINPIDLVPKNIANFKRQMQMIGLSVDFEREMSTTDPTYYGVTQWIFLQLFKMGLAYKKPTNVWFCRDLGTVLSDEEVVETPEGLRSERGDFPVEKKVLNQWTLKITAYADKLTDDLGKLNWPTGILDMQRNWIGRSEGIEIAWQVCSKEGVDSNIGLTTFTTRKDTLPGVTFIVIAPEHELLAALTTPEQSSTVEAYKQKVSGTSDLERQKNKQKSGVFTGSYAKNPINNAVVPIYAADYVLGSYGTGVVMGMPGHDERDREFAKLFNLPVILTTQLPETYSEDMIYTGEGLQINSGEYNNLDNEAAGELIAKQLLSKNKAVLKKNYKIRDWIFSRQRYWGEPFPLVYCEVCAKNRISWRSTSEGEEFAKKHPVARGFYDDNEPMYGWFPEKKLPLELPYVESYKPSGDGTSPLSTMKDWYTTTCPHCSSSAKRETDTMPNWAGSCWYPLYYAISANHREGLDYNNPLSKEVAEDINNWLPVDWYLGGAEHAVLHLLYARFWIKALYDLGYIPFNEPFMSLKNVGMVLGSDGKKMSKSLGNVVNPDDMVHEYGADALRMYEAFMAPFSSEIAWNERAMIGVHRFLQRVNILFTTKENISETHLDNSITDEVNNMTSKIITDLEVVKFNTCIAFLMSTLNVIEVAIKKGEKIDIETSKLFLQNVSIFAPFLSDYLWLFELSQKESLVLSHYVKVSSNTKQSSKNNVAVQVNGKVRAVLNVENITKEEILDLAMQHELVKKFLMGPVKNSIYIPGKVLNIVC
jgi:leucyl-tRNA synthetase